MILPIVVILCGPVGTEVNEVTPSGRLSGGLAAPVNLRCEYLAEPLGIDRTTPRLSWEMVDTRRGAVQTAYQVLVADDPARLSAGDGNLWDSGKVNSDLSIQIVYTGKALRSRMRVWWQVRVWDQDGQPSPWSAPAVWSMGLLEKSDWQAKWVGNAAPPPANTDPLPPPTLRKTFEIADTSNITRATAYATALGLYELRINGRRVGDHVLAPEWTDYHKRIQYQTYDVTDLLRAGSNVIGVIVGDGWYAGRIGLTGIVPGGPPRGI